MNQFPVLTMIFQSFIALYCSVKIPQFYQYFSLGFKYYVNQQMKIFNVVGFLVLCYKVLKLLLQLFQCSSFYFIIVILKFLVQYIQLNIFDNLQICLDLSVVCDLPQIWARFSKLFLYFIYFTRIILCTKVRHSYILCNLIEFA